MTSKTHFKNFVSSLGLVVMIFIFTACDRVDTYVPDRSGVEVGEFSASNDAVVTVMSNGDVTGVTLSWSVSDPNGAMSNVHLHGGESSWAVDQIVASIGSKGVSPEETTVYYLDALDDEGEVLASKQVVVTAKDEFGNEISNSVSEVELEVEVNCEDGEDDDGNGLIDCDDEACADSCEDETVITASFTSGPVAGVATFEEDGTFEMDPEATLYIGDEVTVAWESTYDGVQVKVDGRNLSQYFTGDKAAKGTFTYEIQSDLRTITLTGYQGTEEDEPVTIEVTANIIETPEYVGSFSSNVTPAKHLLKNELYAISWTSSNVSAIEMNGEPVAYTQEAEDIAAQEIANFSEQEFVFTVYDDNADTQSKDYSLTISTESLSSAETLISGTISHVDAGSDAATAYAYAGTKVYKLENYLESATEVFDNAGKTITNAGEVEAAMSPGQDVVGYVETSDGKKFVLTPKQLFLVEEAGVKAIQTFDKNATIEGQTIAVTKSDLVLVGTNKGFFEYKGCDGTNHATCCRVRDMDGDTVDSCSGYVSEATNVRDIAVGYMGSNVYMATYSGLYISHDHGAEFKEITNHRARDNKGVVVSSGYGVYAWSDSTLYKYDVSNIAFEEVTNTSISGNIQYVQSHGGRMFVATDEGLYAKNTLGWFKTDFSGSTPYFVTKATKEEAEDGSQTRKYYFHVIPLSTSGKKASAKYRNHVVGLGTLVRGMMNADN